MSFLDSILVSIFSIVVVFIVLIIIAVCIGLMKNFFIDKKEDKAVEAKQTPVPIKQEDETELIAVITAAIAECMGTSYFKVNAINRIKEKKEEMQTIK